RVLVVLGRLSILLAFACILRRKFSLGLVFVFVAFRRWLTRVRVLLHRLVFVSQLGRLSRHQLVVGVFGRGFRGGIASVRIVVCLAIGVRLVGSSVAQLDARGAGRTRAIRSEEHTSELQSRENLVCRLLLEKKKKNT